MLIGVAVGRYVDDRARRRRPAAVVVVLVAVSTLLYLDVLPWWLKEWMRGSD
ncbi:MAG: hypothetical protein V5A62_17660 [Haloarculaceae archaeon]